MAKSNNAARVCLREYQKQEAQLGLFGPETIEPELLVWAYLHLPNPRREQALKYLCARADRRALFTSIVNQVVERAVSGRKDVRFAELATVMLGEDRALQALWHFAVSTVKNRRRQVL